MENLSSFFLNLEEADQREAVAEILGSTESRLPSGERRSGLLRRALVRPASPGGRRHLKRPLLLGDGKQPGEQSIEGDALAVAHEERAVPAASVSRRGVVSSRFSVCPIAISIYSGWTPVSRESTMVRSGLVTGSPSTVRISAFVGGRFSVCRRTPVRRRCPRSERGSVR